MVSKPHGTRAWSPLQPYPMPVSSHRAPHCRPQSHSHGPQTPALRLCPPRLCFLPFPDLWTPTRCSVFAQMCPLTSTRLCLSIWSAAVSVILGCVPGLSLGPRHRAELDGSCRWMRCVCRGEPAAWESLLAGPGCLAQWELPEGSSPVMFLFVSPAPAQPARSRCSTDEHPINDGRIRRDACMKWELGGENKTSRGDSLGGADLEHVDMH